MSRARHEQHMEIKISLKTLEWRHKDDKIKELKGNRLSGFVRASVIWFRIHPGCGHCSEPSVSINNEVFLD
jgi:hypothetical protein